MTSATITKTNDLISKYSIDDIYKSIDFPVTLKPLNVNIGETNQLIKTHQALVREDTQKILGIVSDSYKLIPHKQILEPVFNYLIKNKYIVHNFQMFKCGARVFIELVNTNKSIRLPSIVENKIDIIFPRLMLINSYDGSFALRFLFGLFRLLCKNGMSAPLETFKNVNINVRQKHIGKKIDMVLQSLGNRVSNFYANFNNIEKIYRKMLSTKITKNKARNIITQVIGKRKTDKVMDLLKGESFNNYDVYNVITYFITHNLNTHPLYKEAKYNKALKLLI